MITEYAKVRTLVSKEGYPAGTVGVVVSVYTTGLACEVELWDEKECPVNVVTYLLSEVEAVQDNQELMTLTFGDPAAFAFSCSFYDVYHETELSVFVKGNNILAFERDCKLLTTRWNLDDLVLWLKEFICNLEEDPYPVDVEGEYAAEKDLKAHEFDSDNDEEFDAYYDRLYEWNLRHRWHPASAGAILADVYFQLVGDSVEVSWNNTDAEEGVTFKNILGGTRIGREWFVSAVGSFIRAYTRHWETTPTDKAFARQLQEKQIFEYGDWVRCEGQIMYVMDSGDDTEPGKLGLMKENAPLIFDKERNMQFPEIIYYPVGSVEKLPEVDVDESVLRRFFRLETTPWKLCEQGLFPFSDNSGTFTLSEEDLKVFASNLAQADAITMDDWEKQFTPGNHVAHVYCPADESDGLSFHLTWNVICDMFTWFDIDEDEPEVITDIVEAYFASKGKPLSEIDAADNLKSAIISYLEDVSFKEELTVDQRKAYVRFLDEMCAKGDTWALEHKAYAYYGGNRIVPCDWKISEQTLLLLERSGDTYAANSLGYIYYSDRLGEPDYDKAFFYFSKAAKAGIVEARYKLSDLYRKGHGTAKDPEKAFRMLKQVYAEQLASIQDGYYGCKYADAALRMGYCFEEGSGCPQDCHKAHEYFLRAKYAIDMRILKSRGFGDDAVKRNIEDSLERIKEKDPDTTISITDLPGYPGSEYADITAEERRELMEGIDYLYNSDYNSDEFDPEGHEEHWDKAAEILEKYSFSDFHQASFEWMCNHCAAAEQYINFANLYFYYGGADHYIDNPYPFLAYLYNGVDWEHDSENAEKADNIFWSIAVGLLQHSGIYHGYADAYDPFEDPALMEARAKTAPAQGIGGCEKG